VLGAVADTVNPFHNYAAVELDWAGNDPTSGSVLVVWLLLPPISGLVP
jgi:hypothetical protein